VQLKLGLGKVLQLNSMLVMGLPLYLKLSIYTTSVFKRRSSACLQETYCTEKQSKNKS